VGAEKEFKLWRNRITLAAIKGQPVSISAGPELPWPENPEEHSFERFLEERSNNNNSDARARRIARRIFSSLKRRL
jgi:hypothetical protein